MTDCGNLHVIDYYLWKVLCNVRNYPSYCSYSSIDLGLSQMGQGIDFDIETERREGWTYD